MCNFLGTEVSKVKLIKLKQLELELTGMAAAHDLQIMKDGFAYSNSLIIRKAGENELEAVSAHWEFIPVWIKNWEEVKAARKQGIPWLNARSETLLSSKMFRNAALKRRCLVLATHFFEWRHYRPTGAAKDKAYPYAVTLPNNPYFFMAGIWQPWTDKETGETLDSFAIVTTGANDLMAQVHNKKQRMPTILPEALAYDWIMKDLTEKEIQEIASFQFPAGEMHAHPVPKEFKILDDPLEQYSYEELEELER